MAFARQGARLTLAARRADVLDEVVAACEAAGATAVAVPTDVTDADAVIELARKAFLAHGAIDVWINNAGVGVVGAFQDAPMEWHRRTVEVNLIGAMHGAHAVLPVFISQGRGTLINTISLAAWLPNPFAASYTASKFGLRGFAASLRQELLAFPDIHVCGVFPAIIDTPGLEHGANAAGRRIDPGPLLYAPETVADAILDLVVRPRDEVAVGWPARPGQISYMLARRPTEWLVGTFARRALERATRVPRSSGALVSPVATGTGESGGWRTRKGLPSAGTVTAIGVIGLVGVLLLGRRLVLGSNASTPAAPRLAARAR